ncbi:MULTISPECIES: PASTA domain-containing protein [Pedobacter]|uniref:PASTA domain containing protein n=1 Tax=Pedobacter heparinus (strain ATCC 13125 / DSM 2366 / CIP 104194 / JCM 7457 / NBRC 12017 / NCIMB 9290 / NRRL B-14731 / HIM 762-3) TaxID=485917 RepID=C6XVI8_PEDHD|nr:MULTISPECIES: PASTA domain-containing protein [Pedobacter]ACU04054.1 PASTA domain containing protein [Pedobacter heparinus DSM 2366]MBB5436493.1 beta-lactam-binding protein with PASTA domain [Pedobacter sp. AK017]
MGKFITYLKTTSFRNNLIAAILTVVVILLAAFFSLRYYTKHGQGLNVPALKGLAFTQAVSKLEELGLRYEVDSVYIMDSPPGIVVDQDPNANTFVKDNRTIYLTINTALAPDSKFPDVEFKSLREAQALIESFGFKLGDTTFKADVSTDVLQASFGGQVIKAGEKLPKGSRIDLVLGNGQGDEEREIPVLIGLTKDEAIFAIRNGAKLNLGMVTYEGTITDSATAVVVKQTPLATDSVTKVKAGTLINITLSNK